ncbi:MAG TPA: F0F1 ATP synthase subunit delta [Streptosporangiaceae bacterium]|nr:F0F1 ATP synthase subunit delta [Streptosporangiaceae bacterium]
MRGVSRTSFAELSERLSAEHITSATVASRLGSELFAVVGLLDTEHGLRRALSDPGKPAAEKAAVAGELLHGKITQRAEGLVGAAVEAHWATTGDMVDAIEQLAVEAMVLAAEAEGNLDDLEDGLFRFGRVVSANPDLRAALADPSLPEEGKRRLLGTLLDGKVTAVTLSLINQMVAHPRGRSLDAALDLCADIAARRRQQLIAVIRSATELSASQRRRLADALARAYGHDIHLDVVIDPSVVGGISVQIGDELIDGTVASRLAAVRRKLAG